MEIWVKIDESEMYEVSNKANIRSYHNYNGGMSDTPHLLKPHINHKGYRCIGLKINDAYTTRRISRLVATAFVENPQNLPQVNHDDGNKLNDLPDNLSWCTNQENRDHAVENDLHAKGEDCGHAKLTEEDILEIRSAHNLGCFTFREIADAYGICKAQAYRIINKQQWKHI